MTPRPTRDILFIMPFFLTAIALALPPAYFTCDLTTATLPRVMLVGEYHDKRNSIAMREILSQAAAHGEYPVGLEPIQFGFGSLLPWDEKSVTRKLGADPAKSLIRGVESPIGIAVTNSYGIRLSQMSPDFNVLIAFAVLVGQARQLPLPSSAIHKMSEKAKTIREYKDISELIALAEKVALDSEFDEVPVERWPAYFRHLLKDRFSKKQLNAFLLLHHKEVIGIINSNYLDQYGGKALPVILNDADKMRFGCVGNPCEIRGRAKEIMTDQRDRDFARTIGQWLCEYSGKFSDIVVALGDNHVKGTTERLKALTDNRIRITNFKSFISSDNEGLLKAVKGIKRLSKESESDPPGSAR